MPHSNRSFFRLMMGRWGIWAVFLSFFAAPFVLIWHTADSRVDGKVPGVIAILAGSAAALFWALSVRRARRLTQLRRVGIPMRAKVTRHTKTGNKKTGAPIYRADWRAENGLSGRTPPLRGERLPEVGADISVLIDPSGKLGGVWDAEV